MKFQPLMKIEIKIDGNNNSKVIKIIERKEEYMLIIIIK